MAVLFFALAYALVGWLRPGWVLEAEFARLRWLAGADEATLVAADHRWRYVETGEGPLVVLVHGFTGAKENWLPLMRELRSDHRLVAPGLRSLSPQPGRSGIRWAGRSSACWRHARRMRSVRWC